jgi:hypothetical protein
MGKQASTVCLMCAPWWQPERLYGATCTLSTRSSRLTSWTRNLRNEKVRGSSPLSSTICFLVLTRRDVRPNQPLEPVRRGTEGLALATMPWLGRLGSGD